MVHRVQGSFAVVVGSDGVERLRRSRGRVRPDWGRGGEIGTGASLQVLRSGARGVGSGESGSAQRTAETNRDGSTRFGTSDECRFEVGPVPGAFPLDGLGAHQRESLVAPLRSSRGGVLACLRRRRWRRWRRRLFLRRRHGRRLMKRSIELEIYIIYVYFMSLLSLLFVLCFQSSV